MIVKKHKGTIFFKTKTKKESESSGTTFYVRLPILTGYDFYSLS